MRIDFGSSHTITKEDLDYIKNNWKGEDYCAEQYEKHKKLFPCKYTYLLNLSQDELVDFCHAATEWAYLNRESMYKNPEPQDKLLASFINTQIESVFDEKTLELAKNGQGLSFLNAFIREKLLSVTVAGKGPSTAITRLENKAHLYKVSRKHVQMKADFTTTRFFGTNKIVDGQSVSNFRPLASAYIMHRYGVLNTLNKASFTVWVPSEGWLGRLLSSYYIAHKNPDRQINYISTDPSGDVVESFWDVVEFLNDFGGVHKLKNWNPDIRQHGSDDDKARFFKHEGIEFDLTWTSPPYSLGFEVYKDSYKIKAIKEGTDSTIDLKDKRGNMYSEAYLTDSGKQMKEIQCGDDFVIDGVKYQMVSKRSGGQSHKKASTNYGWNEIFFRPTVKNAKENLNGKGVMVWNVANVRTHKTLEDDVVRICQEEGFELFETIKYSLSRTPGGIKQKDGTRVNLRETKKNYEPVFAFRLKKD